MSSYDGNLLKKLASDKFAASTGWQGFGFGVAQSLAIYSGTEMLIILTCFLLEISSSFQKPNWRKYSTSSISSNTIVRIGTNSLIQKAG